MELMASVFAASAATAATAGGATTLAATAGAGGFGAAAAGSGILGGLSTAFSVGSAVSSILAGVAGYRTSRDQAALADLNAESARLESEEKALRIRRELVQKVGAARVAFAGSGLDISSGQEIERGYRSEADFETRLAGLGGEINAAGQRMVGAQYRTRSLASLIEAGGRAAGTLLDNKISTIRRG